MEKIIFFGLVIPIFAFVLYLGVSAIMKGSQAKSALKEEANLKNDEFENSLDNKKNLSEEIDKLNNLLKDGVLTKEEFEKAKKKLLDN
jgi:predicted Holliday junction resolvase-like endonuclease